jgi:drug/metabolite transporter (DMT)-like permease
VLRSVLGVGGVGCYFWAIDHLLLADAAMLNKLSPFFVFLLAGAILKEPQRRSTFVALLLAFAGALCVIKPRFDLDVLPALVGLASAFFAGAAYTVLRFLRDRESPETIVFMFSAITVAMTAPVVAIGFSLPTGLDGWWLFGIGLAAAGGQFALTSAYHHAPATEVSLYSYAVILFSAILGFVLFGEVPDLLSVIGGVLILTAGAMVWLLRPRPYSTNTSDSQGQ